MYLALAIYPDYVEGGARDGKKRYSKGYLLDDSMVGTICSGQRNWLKGFNILPLLTVIKTENKIWISKLLQL